TERAPRTAPPWGRAQGRVSAVGGQPGDLPRRDDWRLRPAHAHGTVERVQKPVARARQFLFEEGVGRQTDVHHGEREIQPWRALNRTRGSGIDAGFDTRLTT